MLAFWMDLAPTLVAAHSLRMRAQSILVRVDASTTLNYMILMAEMLLQGKHLITWKKSQGLANDTGIPC